MSRSILLALAVALAAGPIAGQNFGAGDVRRVRETFVKAVLIATAVMIGFMILAQCWPGLLLAGFSKDRDAMAVAMQFLELGEDLVDVVQRVRPLRMARDLRHLPGRQVGVDVARELLALLAEALDLKDTKGVRITQVYPGNTAEQAGFKVGDILVKFDDEAIDVSKPEDAEVFTTMVRRHRIGSKVKIDLIRDGKPMTLEVTLAASPRSTREMVEYQNIRFEFRARDLVFQDRVNQELPSDQKGALITLVERGGWAALASLKVNDIVLAVDNKPIKSVADLREAMKEIESTKPARVVFFVRRGLFTTFLELEPAWPAE